MTSVGKQLTVKKDTWEAIEQLMDSGALSYNESDREELLSKLEEVETDNEQLEVDEETWQLMYKLASKPSYNKASADITRQSRQLLAFILPETIKVIKEDLGTGVDWERLKLLYPGTDIEALDGQLAETLRN